ncbi:MAG: substrate-binding domain-containing protein [Kiloniellaceae bacterium]
MNRFYQLAAPGAVALIVAIALFPAAQRAAAQLAPREPISVVGSEAVFPLAVAAAERFSVKLDRPMPVVERTGTARGFGLFCVDRGAQYPDVATAERRMTRAELGACSRKRIAVSEVKIGFQAVALAQAPSAVPLGLSRRQIFLALARQVPIDGRLVTNPYRLWSDIDFALPVTPIEFFGPPPTSPLWDSFIDLMMAAAANDFPELRGWTAEQRTVLAGALRDDGVFAMLGEDEDSVALEVARRPQALGIFSFNFVQADRGRRLRGVAVDGVVPSLPAIAEGSYAPARPLYLYVKPTHAAAIPGLKDYLAEIMSEAASGPGGYLVDRGLVPLPPGERAALADGAGGLTPLRM